MAKKKVQQLQSFSDSDKDEKKTEKK